MSQTILLTLEFPTAQVLGMYRELNDIQSSFQLDRNIVNYHFLSSTADTISKIATKAYIKDLTTYATSAKRVHSDNKPSGARRHQTKVPPAPEKPDDIFSLEYNNQSIILQASTLINGLLKKNFLCSPRDMKLLQLSDLDLRKIYDAVKTGSNDKFVIIGQILFKKVETHRFFVPLTSYVKISSLNVTTNLVFILGFPN